MKKNELIEKYPDNYKLRALISLIPNVGGALDILLTEKGAKWREERIFEFLSKLESRIVSMESEISSRSISELTNSPETYDLLIQSFNSVIRTRHSEKINCYVNILINHVTHSINKTYSSELMLSILDSLTIEEIEYVSALYNSKGDFVFYKIFGVWVDWEKCKEIIESTGRPPTQKDEIFDECKLKYNLDLLWKLLSDKNIIILDKKEGFEYLDYSYGTSNQFTRSQLTSTHKIEYKLSEFGKYFLLWIMEQ